MDVITRLSLTYDDAKFTDLLSCGDDARDVVNAACAEEGPHAKRRDEIRGNFDGSCRTSLMGTFGSSCIDRKSSARVGAPIEVVVLFELDNSSPKSLYGGVRWDELSVPGEAAR